MKRLLPAILAAGVAGSIGLSYLSQDAAKEVALALANATPIEQLRHARLTNCSNTDACDGGWKEHPNKCTCLTSETDPLPNEVTDVGDLPDAQKMVMVGCCTFANTQYVRWQTINDPVGEECKKLLNEKLHGGESMHGVDLGLAKDLNNLCCGEDTGPVQPGSSGACPFCIYECKSGKPSSTPQGCDDFCAEGNGP